MAMIVFDKAEYLSPGWKPSGGKVLLSKSAVYGIEPAYTPPGGAQACYIYTPQMTFTVMGTVDDVMAKLS